jgi:MFS family permease
MQGSTRKDLLLMAAICTCAVIGWWACLSWIPPWINQLTGKLAVEERSLASTILSIGCLVGCFTTPLFFNRFGRRTTMKICFGAAFLCTAGMFLTVKSYGAPLLFWNFFVGLFANMQFAALANYIPELFATRFLASAMGFCFGAGRILAALTALCGGQLIVLYNGSYALACATLSLIYVVGFIISFWLAETTGKVAVDHVTDTEASKELIAVGK